MYFELTIVLALILFNGLFAMVEMAVISARRARLQRAADKGEIGAEAVLALQADQSRFLSTIQFGITMISVATSAYGGARLADSLTITLAEWPWIGAYAAEVAFGVIVVGIGFLTLILGELAPKRLGLMHPEAIAQYSARTLRPLMIIAGPAVWLLAVATDLVLSVLPKRRLDSDQVTDDEVKLLMREGAQAGAFHETERNIVEMTLRLGDRRVSALMTPRPQMEFLDLQDSEEANMAKLLASHYSRFPIIDGGFEHVLGIVEVKDLLAAPLAGKPIDLRAAIRPVLYIPETAPALKALELFKRQGAPMALIVDEYGDIQGLMTLNDLLESLVGDIAGPGGEDERTVVQREDGSWLIDGMVPIDEVFDLIKLDPTEKAEERDYETLGGFMMATLKRIPQAADFVEIEGFRFEVMDMDGRRVDKVLVAPPK
jgi:putative hemolysin